MAVPTWKRKLSNTEYLFQTYNFCIRLNEIMANKPRKYKTNNIDRILNTAFDALKHCQTANSIFFQQNSSEQDYFTRRKFLQTARGEIQNVATISYIFIETVRRHDSESGEKLYKQEMEIGDYCENINRLIEGVIKSDTEIYKKYIKTR